MQSIPPTTADKQTQAQKRRVHPHQYWSANFILGMGMGIACKSDKPSIIIIIIMGIRHWTALYRLFGGSGPLK